MLGKFAVLQNCSALPSQFDGGDIVFKYIPAEQSTEHMYNTETLQKSFVDRERMVEIFFTAHWNYRDTVCVVGTIELQKQLLQPYVLHVRQIICVHLFRA